MRLIRCFGMGRSAVMKKQTFLFLAVLPLAISAIFPPPAAARAVRPVYLYTLSDFYGPVPYNWVNLASDQTKHEIYVTDTSDRTVRIFGESGMEVYRFGDDGDLGNVISTAIAPNGDIYVLSRKSDTYAITRCNFRGVPQGKVAPANLPPEYVADFLPDSILIRKERLYLVDRNRLKVALTDLNGTFAEGYDLNDLLGSDKRKKADLEIAGFNVDRDGNLLFTIPTVFTAFVISPDRKVRSFGVRGSTPGKFNVASGIAADDRGYIYVMDALRCVVMVFDRDFAFKTEFGYRGFEPGNLIAPYAVEANNDRVYVSQGRARGVNVYRVFSDEPALTEEKGGG